MPDTLVVVSPPSAQDDWRRLAALAVDAVTSDHSKRVYEKALKDFLAWYSAEPRPVLSRAVVQQYRSVLEGAGLAPASVNVRSRPSASSRPRRPRTGCWIAILPKE